MHKNHFGGDRDLDRLITLRTATNPAMTGIATWGAELTETVVGDVGNRQADEAAAGIGPQLRVRPRVEVARVRIERAQGGVHDLAEHLGRVARTLGQRSQRLDGGGGKRGQVHLGRVAALRAAQHGAQPIAVRVRLGAGLHGVQVGGLEFRKVLFLECAGRSRPCSTGHRQENGNGVRLLPGSPSTQGKSAPGVSARWV